ncbi:MAG: cupin domain-containing protein [Proteobacteria bacterium]|nr:cupin domain-containing protein [Pseudomonadota bacterium]
MARIPPDHGSYYDRIAAHHVLPLWVDTGKYVPMAPSPPYEPALWKYSEIRPLLFEAGEVISAEEAGRRVLVLQNPALSGFDGTTRSLYACLQLIMPGEQAPEHRHTQSAMRLVLEGDGAFTTVDGDRVEMEAGDFIITPSWSWHGHVHEGETPMVWLDGLDNGLMAQLDTTFFEPGSPAQPHEDSGGKKQGSRLLRYPYCKARENLDILRKVTEPDACHGYRMEYLDPSDGGPAMSTMTTALMLLDQGFDGDSYQCTDGTIFVALEGEGETTMGERNFAWKRHDVFVVPSWCPHAHRATTDAVLFSFSDRIVQQKLGVWREARGG